MREKIEYNPYLEKFTKLFRTLVKEVVEDGLMPQDELTIGLYGIGGVYNYGCEAIVRGTEIILHTIWPDATIKYASLNPKDDKKRLKGCNVEIIPRKTHHSLSLERINNIAAYNTGFYYKNFFNENIEWVQNCDTILSIGGDIYTFPPKFADSIFKRYYNPLIHFGEIIKEKRKKLIIWGASIGPFEENPKAKKIFVDHLNKVDLIVSREKKTTSYLNKLKIKNVIECPDPAFFVPIPEKIDQDMSFNKRTRIGINLSPLSLIYADGQINQNKLFQRQIEIIKNLVQKYDAEILLIPHVFCDFNVNDDDLRYLKIIKNNLPENIGEYIKIIDNDPGFIGIKNEIKNCDMVIAARMHCAINAITLGIPTIFLSYSQKSIGMVNYVYGNENWILPLKEMTLQNTLNMVESMLMQKKALKNNINNFMNNINTKCYYTIENEL